MDPVGRNHVGRHRAAGSSPRLSLNVAHIPRNLDPAPADFLGGFSLNAETKAAAGMRRCTAGHVWLVSTRIRRGLGFPPAASGKCE